MAGITAHAYSLQGIEPGLTDLLGGHVAIYFSSLPPAIALVREGKVRALAVTGPKRRYAFPDLPTVASGAAGLRGRAALRHRRAGRHAARDRRQAQSPLRAALAEPDVREKIDRRRRRCRCRHAETTPPTSTARRRSGRKS
jgi:tripartite-type tricarboxylate transporter receptor subunit TctC